MGSRNMKGSEWGSGSGNMNRCEGFFSRKV